MTALVMMAPRVPVVTSPTSSTNPLTVILSGLQTARTSKASLARDHVTSSLSLHRKALRRQLYLPNIADYRT